MTLRGPLTVDYLLAWGRHTHRSPLYARLVRVTAEDPDLFDVIRRIHNPPPPNVFFGAIHYLLMEDPTDPLARYYPSLVDDPDPVSGVDGDFRRFVIEREREIVDLANSRYTQTNETRRCAALLPAVMTSPFDSFHLVEIGASAGLNLAMDRFHYSFPGVDWGPASPVEIRADTPGDQPRLRDVEILGRHGIDISVIDRADPDDRRWLEALIWPEHHERRDRLRRAMDLTAGIEIEMVEGSVLDHLGPMLDGLPAGEPAVVVNSFVLNQLLPEQREEVAAIIARGTRPLYRVSLEFIDKDDDWARLEAGEGSLARLGIAHPHGEWVDLDYGLLGPDQVLP